MTRASALLTGVVLAVGCSGRNELSLRVQFEADGHCTMSGDAVGLNPVRGASEVLPSGSSEWRQAVSCAASTPQSMPAVRIRLSRELGALDRIYNIGKGSRIDLGQADLVLMGSDRRCSLGRLSATAGAMTLSRGSKQGGGAVPVGEVSATVVCKFAGFGEIPGPLARNGKLATVCADSGYELGADPPRLCGGRGLQFKRLRRVQQAKQSVFPVHFSKIVAKRGQALLVTARSS